MNNGMTAPVTEFDDPGRLSEAVVAVLWSSDYDAATIVGKIIYYGLALFVLQLEMGVFGPNPISDLPTRIIAFIPALIVAIIIIIIIVVAVIAAAVKP